jgi:hypothetical protein
VLPVLWEGAVAGFCFSVISMDHSPALVYRESRRVAIV